jgi:drug/metabolite transporter (DMT)-like permease
MVESIPPLLAAGGRFLLAAVILTAFLLRKRSVFNDISPAQFMSAGVTGLLILVGGIGLVTVAERDVPSGLAALIIASIPLWVVVLRVAHRENVPRTTIVAVTVGFFGVAVLLSPGQVRTSGGFGPMLLIVLAAVFTAIGAFYSKKFDMPRDVFVATTIEMGVAGIGLLVASLITGEALAGDFTDVTRSSLIAFAYLVVIGSVVAYSAFVWLLENAPISTVATYAYVNPVVALLLGVVVLSERVTATMVVGAGAIVGSVFFVVREQRGA